MELAEAIIRANALFDEMTQERHDRGAQKYGPFKFLGANTLEEAMEEVVDLSNYARYTFVKLYILNVQIDTYTATGRDTAIGDMMPSRPSFLGE